LQSATATRPQVNDVAFVCRLCPVVDLGQLVTACCLLIILPQLHQNGFALFKVSELAGQHVVRKTVVVGEATGVRQRAVVGAHRSLRRPRVRELVFALQLILLEDFGEWTLYCGPLVDVLADVLVLVAEAEAIDVLVQIRGLLLDLLRLQLHQIELIVEEVELVLRFISEA